MATYTNALLVYNAGAVTKIQSSDDLAISGSLVIGGNLNVQGDIISTGSQNVLIADAFLDLSSGYTTATARPSGFTFNVAATGTSRTVTAFTAGVVATSAPTLTCSVDVSGDFAQYDIIQVSGATKPENNGLYIVASVSTTTVSLYGTGGTAVPSYSLFCQSQVTTDTANTATVTKVDLAVLGISDGSVIKSSSGSAITVGAVVRAYYAAAQVTDFNGTGAGTGYIEVGAAVAAPTLQTAYDAGNSITLTSGNNFDINVPGAGTAAITLDANAASHFTVAGADLVLSTTTSGEVDITAVGLVDLNAGANLDVDVTGTVDILATSTFSIDGTGASNVSATSGNLTLSTITSGTLDVTSAGAMDIDAASALQINSSGGAIGIGNDAVAQAINIGTGAAARTVTVGNASGATSVVVNAGTGNIDIGTGAQARATNIATGAAAQTVIIGSTSGASAVTINSGTGDATTTSTNGDIVLDLNTSGYVTAEKDFGTVGTGAFDTELEAGFGGFGGNSIQVSMTSSTSFVISQTSGGSPAGPQVNFQINNGTTTVGHIETAIGGLSVSGVADNGSGLLRVTTTTPHGLATGDYVGISGVTDSGGSGANGDWEVTVISATTFDLVESDSTGYSYSSGGTVVNFNVDGVLAVKTSGTTATVLTSSDTFAATHLAGGVGEGQIIAKRGTITWTTGAGPSGSGAGLVVDSPQAITSDTYAAYLYGEGGVNAISPSTVLLAASNTTSSTARVQISANSTSGQGQVSVRSKNSVNIETTAGGGQINLQSGDAYIQVQQSGDLNINSGTQPINLNSSTTNINITAASGGDVLISGNGGVSVEATAGDITIGTAANNYNIDIGTGGTRVIEVGSNNAPVMLGGTSTTSGSIGTYLPVASADSVTLGNILYLTNASGTPTAAKADGDGSGVLREIVGIALQDGPGSSTADTRVVTVPGSLVNVKFASVPAGDTDIGKPVYLSTTAGEATMTAPSTGRVYRIGILYDGTVVSGSLYKVLYLPAFVADLS